jgi:hypothetical protein
MRAKLRTLEVRLGALLSGAGVVPALWRREAGMLAIHESPFILDRLGSLGKEIIYSSYVFPAVMIDPADSQIVERVEGEKLYLRGLPAPIPEIPGLVWDDEADHHNKATL